MKKSGRNASWHDLSPKQLKLLEQWLFDEKLSYEDALALAKKEFGFQGSLTGLKRFYHRRVEERPMEALTEGRALADQVCGVEVSTRQLRDAGMKLVAQSFLKLVAESPGRVKDWGLMAKLLLQGEENDLKRNLLADASDFRRAKLQFSRARFHYDTVEEALKSLPRLLDLEDARKDPKVKKFEENKRMNDVRRSLFGDVIPEVLPENEEEEAHPEIIEQRYQEAERKLQAQWYRDIMKNREELARARQARGEPPVASPPAAPPVSEPEALEPDPDRPDDPDATLGAKPDDGASGPVYMDDAERPRQTPEERDRQYEELLARADQIRRFHAGKKGPLL